MCIDGRITNEQKWLVVLARELLVRQNPVLGFKTKTPFREWSAQLIAELVKPEHFVYNVDHVNYFVRFIIVNLGSCTSYYEIPHPTPVEEKACQIIYQFLAKSRGTGRQFANDRGGWIWSLIRFLPPELLYDNATLDVRFEEAVRAIMTVLALNSVSTYSEHWEVYPLLSLVRKLTQLYLERAPKPEPEPEQSTACLNCSG